MTRLHPLIHMNDLNSNESLMSWEWVMWWRGYTLLITLRIHEGHFTYEWASSPHNSFMRVVSHMNATYECAMNTNVTYECAMNDIQPIAFEVSFITISNINQIGLFSTERGKRDLEDYIIDWDSRFKKWHSKCNRLFMYIHMSSPATTYICDIWIVHIWMRDEWVMWRRGYTLRYSSSHTDNCR